MERCFPRIPALEIPYAPLAETESLLHQDSLVQLIGSFYIVLRKVNAALQTVIAHESNPYKLVPDGENYDTALLQQEPMDILMISAISLYSINHHSQNFSNVCNIIAQVRQFQTKLSHLINWRIHRSWSQSMNTPVWEHNNMLRARDHILPKAFAKHDDKNLLLIIAKDTA